MDLRSLRAALAAMVVLLAACGAPAGTTPAAQTPGVHAVTLGAGQKLRVVATMNIIGDVVGQVGGDKIALTTLMGLGVDPHNYVPVPRDAAAIADANVLFANGADLEQGMKAILQNPGGQTVVVQLADGLQLLAAPTGPGSEPGTVDPHVWFDVQNVIQWVNTVEHTLSTTDPANAAAYQAKATAYLQQLTVLDGWIVQQVASLPQNRRELVTDHLAFGYLAHRYGFQQLGAVYPLSPSSQPSAQDLAKLENLIRQYQVPAIFTESTVNPQLAEQVARDTGIKVVQLYTESLGGAGSGATTYVDLMRFDVTAMVDALK